MRNFRLLVLGISIALLVGCQSQPKTQSITTVPVSQKQQLVLSWSPGVPVGQLGGWATVNGYRIFVAIDTGSPLNYYYDTQLKEPFVAACKDNSERVHDRIELVKPTLGSWQLEHLTLNDLSGVRDFSDGGRAPTEALVLGSKVLENTWLDWDSAKRTLTISPTTGPVVTGYESIPCMVTRPDGRLFLQGTQNSQPFWIFLDTGTASSFPYVHGASSQIGRTLKGFAKNQPWFSTIFPSHHFQFAGQEVSNFPVYVSDRQPIDQAQVGLAFVKNFDWVFDDSGAGRFWAKIPPSYFKQASQSFGFSLSVRRAEKDFEIYVNARLEEAGSDAPPLNAQVVEVNGRSVKAQDFPLIEQALQGPTLTLGWIEAGQLKTAGYSKAPIFANE